MTAMNPNWLTDRALTAFTISYKIRDKGEGGVVQGTWSFD